MQLRRKGSFADFMRSWLALCLAHYLTHRASSVADLMALCKLALAFELARGGIAIEGL